MTSADLLSLGMLAVIVLAFVGAWRSE